MNTIIINGTRIQCSIGNVEIIGQSIIVDGKEINHKDFKQVTIEGNVGKISATGNVTINGNVNGDIDAGGSVSCGDVEGDIDAGGSIQAKNVSGDIDAGGSVSIRK